MSIDIGKHGLYKLSVPLTSPSDILYSWAPRVKHEEARTLLKTALKSLSEPSSYLYNEETGIELKLAMSGDGSRRFLIPSRHIEYLRYRICLENELSPACLPLPSSAYYVDLSQYSHITPTTYTIPSELTRDMRRFHRQGKSKKRGGDDNISTHDLSSYYFERVRSDFDDGKKGFLKVRYVAVDVESWELDHMVITEIGYSQLHFENENQVITPGHIIITDHTRYKNGNYVTDNRFNFRHGKSQQLNLQETRVFLKQLLTPIANEKVVMVMHGVKNDMLSLDTMFQLKGRKHSANATHYSIPAESSSKEEFQVEVLDTNRLLTCIGDNLEGVSLSDFSQILKVDTPKGAFETRDYYHNAGNDAYVTLISFIRFANGLALERQRQQLIPTIQAVLMPPVEEVTERMEDVL
ncbi:hypothetical protein E3P89_02197 [Wallemia ichthyophaga]|uniref:Gfd2/YDR514C-like C-terminal domain-containing protein n=1 Tax=Wallemia ichthyophaga TaxID=245174 RepID=A0A4T0L1J5_WALIC|nr:hypothetical protein E3P91_02387 [Wallemia ichthyophaga]TIB11725.1 hypothetical protein E3P90_02332 [Wallemia ichthyophaga]TIB13061.1 hypothetical protein E3P93_02092 [Wallemia ichthyophaga]TIB22233.1 hypothetical protein E3P89_02197 [Wallemia ichthyophaga]TIB23990.1 hypothetical protein E3P88_02288 [Wallemia ichthyophaga]